MQWLYVIHQFFPDCHSGTEQYCLAMAREARRRGDRVTVLSLHYEWGRHSPPIELFEQPYDGFRVIRLSHWIGVNPNLVLRDYENLHLEGWFQTVIEDVRPDAVHFFHLRQLGSNLIPAARRAGVPTVVSLTDFWHLCPRFTLLRRDGSLCEGPPDGGLGCVSCEYPDLANQTPTPGAAPLTDAAPARLRALIDRLPHNLRNLTTADVVAAPSHFLASMFAKNGFPLDRMRVVPYGLDPDRISPVPTRRPRTPMRLAFCGVLSPWKAPHLVAQAVHGSDLDVQLTIHGRVQEEMFQGYIDEMIAAVAGDPRIRFPGPYDAASVASVFAEMDVLVVPSVWYENTPFVVLEALAANVYVIASDLGGLREVVRHGENGHLFAANDVGMLRQTIRAVMDREWPQNSRPHVVPSMSDNYDAFRGAVDSLKG